MPWRTSEPEPLQLTPAFGISTTDTPESLAEQAYQNDDRLLFRFERDDKVIYGSAILPPRRTDSASARRLPSQSSRLPVTLPVEETSQPGRQIPASARPLPITGVATWLECRDR